MAIFILFVLILCVGAHSYGTRQRLVNVANLIDQAHEAIRRTFTEDQERIDELEATLRNIRIALKKRSPKI